MRLYEIERRDWFHLSNDPDLNPKEDFEHHQGQLGRGFYVTTDPEVWADSLGRRKHLYRIVNADDFRIAGGDDFPSWEKLTDWAIQNGYMERRVIRRPNGGIVPDLDGNPLIRPDLTAKGKELLWQDPMTGESMAGLQNLYLIKHGFDGYDPPYSRDGQQIILFDPKKVQLERLN